MRPLTRSTPNFAPDGFAASLKQRLGAGLNYAVAATIAGRIAPGATSQQSEARREASHSHNQDGYDEGLVHSHFWACNQ